MSLLIIALARECIYAIAKTSGNKEDKKWLGGTRPLPEQIFLGAKRRKRTVRSSTLLWGLRRVSYLLTFATATERRDRSEEEKKKFMSSRNFPPCANLRIENTRRNRDKREECWQYM